ncbi:MAG: MarR family transcriptional regulator [Clostridia bacterium]|nr:MarR family transcriptional regulator [Clostridia bacterium]
MTDETCINIINFQQSIQKVCKSKAKTLEKEIFSLKFKILILIFSFKNISPTKIKDELSLAKSNVAMFCKTLQKEGKIESVEDKKDRRAIYYNLTKLGEKYVSSRLKEFSKNFEEKYSVNTLLKIEKNINSLCEILSHQKGE